jgi:CopG antitoxin of type II toxin-antitoxin system
MKGHYMSKRTISAEELDRRFDEGESVIEFLDLGKIVKGARNMSRRVNLDMPVGMIAELDKQARKRGVSRQSLMKMWLADKLDSAA